ncbi:DNA-binding transcriptional regulator, LysR family [Lachnospiraceae bacterium XBB1006]|nr:DNA-binding transcriptional regulator, LysR family [Lachnospiraceae bacterium XBB1006]
MELKQLESYVAVVEYGSFTKAAEKLFISQPTISTHIQMLEMELHTKLLDRHTKRMEVTRKGEELYECASEMLAMRDRLLKSWDEEEKKTIHLGASTIPSTYVLPRLLSEYKKLYPEVQFIIHQGDSQQVIDGILSDAFQVGFIGMEESVEEVTCQPCFSDRIVLITPNTMRYTSMHNEFLKKHDTGILRDILKSDGFITREGGSGSKRYADRVLSELGLKEENLTICARLNDSESIKNMVMEGLGVALVSENAIKNCCEEGMLQVFEIPFEAAKRTLNMVYRKKNIFRPYEEIFVDYVAEHYQV